MELIADIVIIAIVAVSAVIGYKKGLIRTLFRCLTVVVAIVVAFYTGPLLGGYIKNTDTYALMSQSVEQEISDYFDEAVQEELEDAKKTAAEFEKKPLAKTLTRLGFDSDKIHEHYEEAAISGAENVKTEFVGALTEYILSCLAKALGHLLMFVLALVVIKLLGIVAEKLFRLPVLKTVNRAGGAILGTVFGLAAAYIVCMAVEILLPYIPSNPVVYMGMAENTLLYKYFVDFNLVIFLLLG